MSLRHRMRKTYFSVSRSYMVWKCSSPFGWRVSWLMVYESHMVCQRTRSGIIAVVQSYPRSRFGPCAPRSANVFICTSKPLISDPPSWGSPHAIFKNAVELDVIQGGSGRLGSPGSVLHSDTAPGSSGVPSDVHGLQPCGQGATTQGNQKRKQNQPRTCVRVRFEKL